jgi:TM2 domain-containing membrane protein YozV
MCFQSEAVQNYFREAYTTNAVCTKNRCVNPIFPGLEDLHQLAQQRWRCTALRQIQSSLHFCQPLLNYDPAVLVTTTFGTNESVEAAVLKQDGAASTAFFYHLAGLGLEAWDYSKPWLSDDECIKAVWRLSCYTYFPRSNMGCYEGSETTYTRPCKSSCSNYIQQCGVECCDESVQCVFSHDKTLPNNAVMHTEGYSPHDGPSSLCTGAASRQLSGGCGLSIFLSICLLMFNSRSSTAATSQPVTTKSRADFGTFPRLPRYVRQIALAVLVALCALSLEGCTSMSTADINNLDVPSHSVGNWRAEPDYLLTYEFVPPGGSALDARLNSCSLDHLSQTHQCNGRGVCRMWIHDGLVHGHPTMFCECDRDWADPECRTRRKSQAAAYLLSLFFGFLGADQFYLGNMGAGIFKLFTFGGGGLLWIVDIMRVGSAPVKTQQFRVAADLPHWVFALMTCSTALTIGFVAGYVSVMGYRARRRKDALFIQGEQERLFHKEAIAKASHSRIEAPHNKTTYGSAGGGRVHRSVIQT